MSEQAITDPGPVEQGVRTFLSSTAHSDVALSALALSAAQSVDMAEPGTRAHSYSVESLRKLLDDLRDTVKPEFDEKDPFALLMQGLH